MTDYLLGPVSSAAAANITQVQQQANLQQTQVFNPSASGTRMLMFAFEGAGTGSTWGATA